MEFLSFDLSKKFKELGFNEKTYAFYMPGGTFSHVYSQFRGAIVDDCTCNFNNYDNNVYGHDNLDAPTLNQVLDWLLENKNIYVSAIAESPDTWFGEIHFLNEGKTITLVDSVNSRNEAYIAAITKYFELL